MTTTETTGVGGSRDGAISIPLGTLPPGLRVPMPADGCTPVEYAEALGEAYLSFSRHNHRKSGGHYLTPAAIASFMAGHSSYSEPHMRVLDPGSGSGILSAAVCEAACRSGTVKTLHVDAYEIEQSLAHLSSLVLSFAQDWLDRRGVALMFNVTHGDFLLEHTADLRARSENGLWERNEGPSAEYDLVVSNPPYFKIAKEDPRAMAWESAVHGQPNIYAPVHGGLRRAAVAVRGARVHRAEELCIGAVLQEIQGSLLSESCPHSHPSLRVQEGRVQESDRAPGKPGNRGQAP